MKKTDFVSKEMQEEIKKTWHQNHYMGGQIHHGFLRVLRKDFPLSDGRPGGLAENRTRYAVL